jgi:hypothetical protein
MLESLSDLSGVRKLTSIEDVRSVLLVILENPEGSDPQSDKNYHKQYRRIRTIQLFHAWFVDVCSPHLCVGFLFLILYPGLLLLPPPP